MYFKAHAVAERVPELRAVAGLFYDAARNGVDVAADRSGAHCRYRGFIGFEDG